MRNLPSDPPRRDAFHDFPLADADLCVKCGLCLPHCPTYKVSQHEGDSPRGRIALMQGLAEGSLAPEGAALPHLDGCLVCRACETVCPAQVPYGRLIDAGRVGLWRSGHRPGGMWRLLAFLRRTPARLAWLERLLRAADVTGLAKLTAMLPLGRVARAAAFVENTARSPAVTKHRPSDGGEHVALFLGCVARALDAKTLHATVRVLEAMGYHVDVPEKQTCCGAMDAHAGDRKTAAGLARANIAAFAKKVPVVTTASGCGVQLQDFRELRVEHAGAFSTRVADIMHFIAAHADRLPPLNASHARVAVHVPCTLRNGMRATGGLAVLERIPGIRLESIPHRDCCGAAGSYLFEHAESADQLGERLVDALGEDPPDILVTSNVGCALHVRRLAARRGLSLQVMHPVQLLAASLPADPPAGL